MIVYMGSLNRVCDLSIVVEGLLDEGYSPENVVQEVIEFCARNGVLVYTFDVERMLEEVVGLGCG
ncbi:hypothetical protein [Marinobacter qingdaonensis]|uniref:Uncharacterized protein n=1 Tax=Marinobacter qingdaonensis TaxID=3108486 RepID=A0ABU5NYG3_9GAMM|nr:hypothetical protein [Marinobacter sp. ASW11-75]MEA1080858.1 hypothetical protein [Marinobacter sp. ASW11-75]